MKKYGSVKILKRIKEWSIDDGLRIIKEKISLGDSELGRSLAGYPINFQEDRYLCFIRNGCVCIRCKKEASFFALEYISSTSHTGYALNLYSLDDNSEEYFTKDHTIPKSLGGKDCIDNYQTMCWTCNHTKGNSIY